MPNKGSCVENYITTTSVLLMYHRNKTHHGVPSAMFTVISSAANNASGGRAVGRVQGVTENLF